MMGNAGEGKAGAPGGHRQDGRAQKNYKDIIDLPHPTSKRHPRMSALERAAQFSPFAALTGYEDAVKETGRLTGQRIELSEEQKAQLDEVLDVAAAHLSERPFVSVSHFEPDQRKAGGAYRRYDGNLKKIDETAGKLLFTDGMEISVSDIAKMHLPDRF